MIPLLASKPRWPPCVPVRSVLVADDEDRENEGDLIFAAETMTNEQMAMMIHECSGIVCLCLTDERVRQLELPMMVEANSQPLSDCLHCDHRSGRG